MLGHLAFVPSADCLGRLLHPTSCSLSLAQPVSFGCTSADTLQLARPRQPTIRSLPDSADHGESCQARTAAFAFTDQSEVGLFLLAMAWHHHRRKSLHA